MQRWAGLHNTDNVVYSSNMTTNANTTTAALIAEYDALIVARWDKCQMGSSRAASRQRKIDAIVDAISDRADDGDAVALDWYANA